MQPIRLEGVQFEWQAGIPVIDISSFRLKLGSRCFLKGPSGTGKTTLLGLIGGVLLPNKGSVNILNTEINLLPISKRDTFRANHIGYIFQQFNLIPYLTVLNNVILPASFSPLRSLRSIQKSGSIEKEAIRLLARLGLQGDDILHRPVTGLSIGQQQRVAAARALLGCPEIIIADEPTSSLDYRNRESFLELLFEECSEGGSTLLFVSHDSTLEGLFDQVITLDSVNHADLAKQEIC